MILNLPSQGERSKSDPLEAASLSDSQYHCSNAYSRGSANYRAPWTPNCVDLPFGLFHKKDNKNIMISYSVEFEGSAHEVWKTSGEADELL